MPRAKPRHPRIHGLDIAVTGNVYRHGYRRVALDIAWKTVHDRLPVINAAFRAELDTISAS